MKAITFSDFRTYYKIRKQYDTCIKTNFKINGMDGFEKPVINLHMHNYMIFDKGAKIIKKGKDNKMLPEKLDIFFRRINLDFYFILHINIWNQSVVLCPVQTVVPLPAYRFLKNQVR